MPYEISHANSTLVIGGGGGEDVLVALAGGSKNVTVVEINPLVISAVKRFGGDSGVANLYERKDVKLFIDDGRRFISSTNTKYDRIIIKLVDSWAAPACWWLCTFRKLSLYCRGVKTISTSLRRR